VALQYNVATLLREPVGSTREYDIDDRVLIDDTDEESRRVGVPRARAKGVFTDEEVFRLIS